MTIIMPRTSKEEKTNSKQSNQNSKTTKTLSLIGAATPPPPQPTPPSPSPDPSKTSIFSDFASNMISGFSMGVGSSLGRKAVDSVFSGSPAPEPSIPLQKPIETNNFTKTRHLCDAYLECLKDNNNNHDFCEQFDLCKMND